VIFVVLREEKKKRNTGEDPGGTPNNHVPLVKQNEGRRPQRKQLILPRSEILLCQIFACRNKKKGRGKETWGRESFRRGVKDCKE